jgi:branched-subunit amino acid aminotransferase/4-amino-4-deoxychorismate lyase
MHDLVFLNDAIVPLKKAGIAAVSSAALYGKGVFTTIAIHDAKPFLLGKHWERLQSDAARVGIHIWEYPAESVAGALAGLIEKNSVKNGRARVTFFDERGGGVWETDAECETSLLITTGDTRPVPEKLKLTLSPYILNSRSPLAGVKSCSYLENLLALDEAKGRGFDEAIRLNDRGLIASGCMANIFWRKDGQLYTPGLTSGCLAGTTRGFVIGKLGAIETEAGPDVLETADAIIVTSAGLGIIEAAELDGRKLEVRNYDLRTL